MIEHQKDVQKLYENHNPLCILFYCITGYFVVTVKITGMHFSYSNTVFVWPTEHKVRSPIMNEAPVTWSCEIPWVEDYVV